MLLSSNFRIVTKNISVLRVNDLFSFLIYRIYDLICFFVGRNQKILSSRIDTDFLIAVIINIIIRFYYQIRIYSCHQEDSSVSAYMSRAKGLSFIDL